MDWRNNVRLLTCLDKPIRPCPDCKHHFGEHNWVGDCLACMRASNQCKVVMHDAWPDLVPAIA